MLNIFSYHIFSDKIDWNFGGSENEDNDDNNDGSSTENKNTLKGNDPGKSILRAFIIEKIFYLITF